MSVEIYEVAALAMRYVLTGIALLIVLRAWRTTVRDSHRANKLRAWSPETGLAGEFVVLEGGQRAPEGTRYPVIREGMLGNSAKADIRVRHPSVRKRHLWFTMEENGLRVRCEHGATVLYRAARLKDDVLPDGAVIRVGQVRLLLVLTDAPRVAAAEAGEDVLRREWDDELFSVGGAPAPGEGGADGARAPQGAHRAAAAAKSEGRPAPRAREAAGRPRPAGRRGAKPAGKSGRAHKEEKRDEVLDSLFETDGGREK